MAVITLQRRASVNVGSNTDVTWYVFGRASRHMRREEKPTKCHWMVYYTYNKQHVSGTSMPIISMRREEKPTKCHWMVYCPYNMLNMFRALLCPSSGARVYMFVITAYGVQCLVAGCWGSDAGQQAVSSNQGMHTIGSSKTHIVSSFWWWTKKCPETCWEHYKCNKSFSGI